MLPIKKKKRLYQNLGCAEVRTHLCALCLCGLSCCVYQALSFPLLHRDTMCSLTSFRGLDPGSDKCKNVLQDERRCCQRANKQGASWEEEMYDLGVFVSPPPQDT